MGSSVKSIEKGHVNNGNVATFILKWESNFYSHAKVLSTSLPESTYVSTSLGFGGGDGGGGHAHKISSHSPSDAHFQMTSLHVGQYGHAKGMRQEYLCTEVSAEWTLGYTMARTQGKERTVAGSDTLLACLNKGVQICLVMRVCMHVSTNYC